MTLYIVLTGEYPFRGENMYKLFENIASAVYVPAPGVDDSADALLRQLMQKDPRQRPSINEIRRSQWMLIPMDPKQPWVPVRPEHRAHAAARCEPPRGLTGAAALVRPSGFGSFARAHS